MAYVDLYVPTSTIEDISNYALYGEARAGSNGDPYGEPAGVLASETNANTEQVNWYDFDSDGGLYTANVAVKLDANLATGQDTWSIAGGTDDPVTLAGPSGETVDYVELVAGTQVGARVAWSNVQVQFLQGGQVQETVAVGNGPTVDTRSTGGTAEQVETIQPAGSSDDEAIVTGNIKMLCPDGTYPGPDDMFAQAFVFHH